MATKEGIRVSDMVVVFNRFALVKKVWLKEGDTRKVRPVKGSGADQADIEVTNEGLVQRLFTSKYNGKHVIAMGDNKFPLPKVGSHADFRIAPGIKRRFERAA